LRLLYLTHPKEDYLQDQFLIGLRRVLGSDCIDYPRKDRVYKDCARPSSNLYGRGFTIWKTLESPGIDRSTVSTEVRGGEFDLIVFGSIWRQLDTFQEFEQEGLFSLSNTQFAFLDGEDIPSSPPGFLQKGKDTLRRLIPGYHLPSKEHPTSISASNPVLSPALQYGPYFKRELPDTYSPERTAEYPVFPISFSIPEEKIRASPLPKKSRYPRQVQCEEAYKIEEVQKRSTPDSIFTAEEEYYDDIASAKFGITQKKAGWECMRHYEIAANLTVPCFYNLTDKPFLTSPHGLQDFHNCLTFQSAEELSSKVRYVKQRGIYNHLRKNSTTWVKKHTCTSAATRLLTKLGFEVPVEEH
jgi:hypothetical protein